LDKDLGLNDE
jgi:hypothetical protein